MGERIPTAYRQEQTIQLKDDLRVSYRLGLLGGEQVWFLPCHLIPEQLLQVVTVTDVPLQNNFHLNSGNANQLDSCSLQEFMERDKFLLLDIRRKIDST